MDTTGHNDEVVCQHKKHNDEVVCQHKKILDGILVEELQRLIYNIMQRHCPGCQVDHPSQLKHPCLFTPPIEWVELYFEGALQELDMEKVNRLFFDVVTRTHQPIPLNTTNLQWLRDIKHEVSQNCSHPDQLWISAWKDKVKAGWQNSDFL